MNRPAMPSADPKPTARRVFPGAGRPVRGGRDLSWTGILGWLFACLLALPAPGRAAEDDTSPTTDSRTRAGRGFWYTHEQDLSVPWSIHVFKFRRGHPDFELHTTLGRGVTFGMAPVSEQMKTIPHELGSPVAAVNGDFYSNNSRYRGRPRDLQIVRGELVSAPKGNAVFWIDAEGNPQTTNLQSRLRLVWPDGSVTPTGLNEERRPDAAVLYTAAVGSSTRAEGGLELLLEPGPGEAWLPLAAGRTYVARVREMRPEGDTPLGPGVLVASIGPRLAGQVPAVAPGAVVRVITETFPSLAGVQTAIGGGPTLVHDGRAMTWTGFQMRHPRSAVGFDRDFIYLVEVDGRQGGLSVGMSFAELAAYMVKLGCESAMNLDGGGSATMWIFGNVISSPSEGRERPAPNALTVVEKPRKARLE